MWSWWIVVSGTGRKLRRLQAIADNSTTRLNAAGEGRHSFLLRGARTTRAQNQDLFSQWRRMVVKCWNGVPKYAGFITDFNWRSSDGIIDVETIEFRAILARRLPYGIGSYAGGTLVCSGQSRRGIMYQLVYRGTKGALSLGWDLPVSFPATSEAGGLDQTYPNYKFISIEAGLTEQQNVGGDVDFEPRWNANGDLEFLLRIAPDNAPKLGGNLVQLTKSAVRPSALELVLASAGSRMQTGSFAIGDGAEADRPHGEAAVVATPDGVPSLDIAKAFTRSSDVNELNAQALGQINAVQNPVKQYEFSVLADRVMPQVQNGSTVRIYTTGDEMIDPGWLDLRCIGATHSTKRKMSLRVQEI